MGCSQGQACFGKVQEAEWYQKLRRSISGSVLFIFRAAKDHSETNQDATLKKNTSKWLQTTALSNCYEQSLFKKFKSG